MAIINTTIIDTMTDISAFTSNNIDIADIAIYLQDNNIANTTNIIIYL